MSLTHVRPGRSRRPVSLWTRIVSLIALVLVAGTITTGALSLFLLNRTLIDAIDQDLQRAATPSRISTPQQQLAIVTAPTKLGTDSGAYAPVDYVVEWRDGTSGRTIRKIEQTTDNDMDLVFPELTHDQIVALQGEPFTVMDSEQQRWRVLAVTSTSATGDDGNSTSMFMALPMRSVDATMNEMALIIVLVGTMVVLVGVGVGGFVAHRALEPLRDVERTARNVVAGTLNRRVPVSYSSHEVHSLSVALNEMLVRLQTSFEKQAQSEAQAIASQSKMRRFVADASHELRTPLAAIRGNGELYRMGAFQTDEDVSQAMRRIEDEAKRMGSLVENLLRLARLDEQRTFDLVPFDISGIVKDAAQDLRAIDPDREVTVTDLSGTSYLDPGDIPKLGVLGDDAALRQVIVNLVGNANRHTPKGSPVELALGVSRDGKALVEVRDHGEGIPQDVRDKVFERFFRTDESRQRQATQGGGAGLGLSIAATIVQHHNGQITIHQTEGGGATFRVSLPKAELPS